jgi:hypothetical protein
VRGPGARELGLALPPARMPLLRRGTPLKRWRYVGVYGPELMLCAGEARVGGIPQRWWAIAEPDGSLHGRTTLGRGGVRLDESRARVRSGAVSVDLELGEGEPVEVVSATGRRGYIWTRKRGGVPARGTVAIGGRRIELNAEAIVDESAGYHERHTAWRWSAGVGRAEGGERIAWNLVTGVHDSPEASERTLWVDGRPSEVGPVEFAADLSRVRFAERSGGELRFREWAAREHRTRAVLFRSSYRQPFGIFEGELPGGLRLVEGYGVMEEHDAWW